MQILHYLITEGEGPWTLEIGMGSPGEPVWSTQVQIPATANEYVGTWTTEREYLAGEHIYFHVSNHGANVWSLSALTATS